MSGKTLYDVELRRRAVELYEKGRGVRRVAAWEGLLEPPSKTGPVRGCGYSRGRKKLRDLTIVV